MNMPGTHDKKNRAERKSPDTFFDPRLSGTAKLFIGAVVTLGSLAFVYSAYTWSLAPQTAVGYFLILTALASLATIKMPSERAEGGTVSISLADFFVFGAMLTLGPAAAALTGAVEGLFCSWMVKVRFAYKILFNICQLTLVAFAVGLMISTFQVGLTEGPNRSLALVSLGLLAALIYFTLNSLLVVWAMALSSGRNLVNQVKNGFLWALPTNCTNAVTVAAFLSILTPIDPWLAIALVPLIVAGYLLRRFTSKPNLEETSSGLFSTRLFADPVPDGARSYILVLFVVAAPIYLWCVHRSFTGYDLSWLYLVGLTALASWFPLQIFSLKDRIWITLSDVFILGALIQFGPEVAVVMASVETLSFLIRTRPKRTYRWMFNLAQPIVSAFLIGQLFWYLKSELGTWSSTELGSMLMLLAVTMLCGFIYFSMASGLTTLAISLSSNLPFTSVWRKNLVWFYPSVLGAIAAVTLFFIWS